MINNNNLPLFFLLWFQKDQIEESPSTKVLLDVRRNKKKAKDRLNRYTKMKITCQDDEPANNLDFETTLDRMYTSVLLSLLKITNDEEIV